MKLIGKQPENAVLVHASNSAFVNGQAKTLSHKGEVLFNIRRKSEPYRKMTNLYRWGGFVLLIALGLMMLSALILVPVMLSVIRMELEQSSPSIIFLLMSFTCLPASIIIAIVGITRLFEAYSLIFPENSYYFSLYRRLLNKNEIFEGRITALRDIGDTSRKVYIKGIEIDYQFVKNTSTRFPTEFHGKYTAFEASHLQIGDLVLVLYHDHKIHILL